MLSELGGGCATIAGRNGIVYLDEANRCEISRCCGDANNMAWGLARSGDGEQIATGGEQEKRRRDNGLCRSGCSSMKVTHDFILSWFDR